MRGAGRYRPFLDEILEANPPTSFAVSPVRNKPVLVMPHPADLGEINYLGRRRERLRGSFRHFTTNNLLISSDGTEDWKMRPRRRRTRMRMNSGRRSR